MKIAQVTPGYYPCIGGVETHVKEISERLVKRGYEIEVLTTRPKRGLPQDEIINGVKVKRFKSWAPNESYYFSRDLKRYLAKNSCHYDVVHAHSYHAFPALYAVQAKRRNKFVFTAHYHESGHTFFRSLLHVFYRSIGKELFERADYIICVSKYEKHLVLKNFRVNEKKIVVIPDGINPVDFNGLKKGGKNSDRTILYVGRLEKYKGVHYIIEALPKLSCDIFFDIIGAGPYKRKLVSLINTLGIASRVRFHQDLPREELLQKYADADVFVMLSKHEAFGISVAEALASRTPCIVANTSALKEWVDNQNCFGIDYPVSIDELVRKIDEVIEKRAVNVSNFLSWDNVADELVELYGAL